MLLDLGMNAGTTGVTAIVALLLPAVGVATAEDADDDEDGVCDTFAKGVDAGVIDPAGFAGASSSKLRKSSS